MKSNKLIDIIDLDGEVDIISEILEEREMMKKQIKSGTEIIAQVAIMGARRGTGWRYCTYVADKNCKSGYKFTGAMTGGMYPNKINFEWSEKFENRMKSEGNIVIKNRPNQHRNTPKVI